MMAVKRRLNRKLQEQAATLRDLSRAVGIPQRLESTPESTGIMTDNPQVQVLLEKLLDSDATPEEVCSSCPELLPVVRRRWEEYRRVRAALGALFPSADEPIPKPQEWSVLPQIPGYEVEAILGRGGMGIVFRARHLRLNRMVAVKMMLAGAYAGSHEAERFQQEAEAVAALLHPNVVQIHDIGDSEGRPYFTMEFVEGGSLAQKLAGAPLPVREAAALAATLAEAVHAAHQKGIVHRDLKPANVLLTTDGIPKISDFGLARKGDDPGLTRSGTAFGTPSYMAPEQARGQTEAIGPAADIYALGAILYEMLTGRPPFRAESAAATVLQVISEDPAPPSRLNGRVPRDLETVCLKCLQKATPHRYASAQALVDDLKRFDAGRPILARPLGWGSQVWRWSRRNPTMAGLLAALVALFLLALGAGLWLESQKAERRGRAIEAVESALAQIPGLQHQGRWLEARNLTDLITNRLDEAGSEDLRQRVKQTMDDIQLASELEQIRLTPQIAQSRTFNYAGMAAAYDHSFKQKGLDITEDPPTVASRIRASGVQPQIVMALDHWAFLVDTHKDRSTMARLLTLARLADPDPEWGDLLRDPALWETSDAMRKMAAELKQRLTRETLKKGLRTTLLTLIAKKLGQKELDAEPLMRAAQSQYPEDFWLNYGLGEMLRERKPDEAVGFYRAALATRSQVATVHHELGFALIRSGRIDEALQEAQKVVDLIPGEKVAHHQLGLCLYAKGRTKEAMTEFHRAIQIDPNYSYPIYQLGVCLKSLGELDGAMAEFRRAIRIDPNSAPAHAILGASLQYVGQVDEAMTELRHAIDLDPTMSVAYHELGVCFRVRGEFEEAIAEFRRANELDPKGAPAHYELGICLKAKGQFNEAAVEFRRAVELDPQGWLGSNGLVDSLLGSGRFQEARMAALRGLESLPLKEPSRSDVTEKLKQCERLLALDSRLPLILHGRERHTAAELRDFARLCLGNGRPQAAVVLYELAFADRPALLDDLESDDRYNAASSAALAGTGHGLSGVQFGAKELAGLRRKALAWLRADLALRTKLSQGGKSVGEDLSSWQHDNDLRCIRESAELAKLPADERESWRLFWDEVETLRAADPTEQGRTYAAHRQWTQAADAYARALKRGPTDDGHFWYEYAAVLLLSGDRPGYARACAHMVETCGKPGGPRAYHVARACTLASGAVPDMSLPRRLAEKELKDRGAEFFAMTEEGALRYRAGQYQDAIPFLKKSLQVEPKLGRAVLNFLWIAMAEQRLGHTEEARRWLNNATKWLSQLDNGIPSRADELELHLHNWLEAQVLCREAEALIRAEEKH
jgi:tetratricopeptide (TPR) repeat protein